MKSSYGAMEGVMQLKLISCIIVLVGVFLIAATIDASNTPMIDAVDYEVYIPMQNSIPDALIAYNNATNITWLELTVDGGFVMNDEKYIPYGYYKSAHARDYTPFEYYQIYYIDDNWTPRYVTDIKKRTVCSQLVIVGEDCWEKNDRHLVMFLHRNDAERMSELIELSELVR